MSVSNAGDFNNRVAIGRKGYIQYYVCHAVKVVISQRRERWQSLEDLSCSSSSGAAVARQQLPSTLHLERSHRLANIIVI